MKKSNTINERLAELIKNLDMSKTEFAKSVKVTQPYISKLVISGSPSDVLIETICSKHNVNEDWLRYGNGEIFIKKTISEETYGRFGYLMENASPEKRAFITSLLSLVERLPDTEFTKLQEEYQNALHEAKEES